MSKMLRIRLFALFFLCCCWCTGCTGGDSGKATSRVRVACAANARAAISEILTSFATETGIETELVSGSSGKLATQIQHGAPYDLFISADMAYPELLRSEGFAKEAPVNYATGSLVAWVSQPEAAMQFPEAFLDPQVTRIAIANPEVAPFGAAALQALQESGHYAQIKDKLVFGESIGQVNQYIRTRSVDAAITSNSFAREMPGEHSSLIAIPARFHAPLYQGALLLSQPERGTQATVRKLLTFLKRDSAKTILEKYGYTVGESSEGNLRK